MRMKDYAERENGKRVWLSEKEIQRIIPSHTSDAGSAAQLEKLRERRAALILAGRCGLRRKEITGDQDQPGVRPKDIVTNDTGSVVRVWHGKGDKYREVPAPAELTQLALNLNRDPEAELVSVVDTTIYDWVEREAKRCYSETGEDGWLFVGPHDLRRSWGVRLLESGVLPSVVMEWGGWDDWQTFRDHYLAEFSPEALRRERGKVSWLGGKPDREGMSYAAVSTGMSAGVRPQG